MGSVLFHDGSFVASKSHFIGRSTVDLHKNGDLLKLKMPLRGKTVLNFGEDGSFSDLNSA